MKTSIYFLEFRSAIAMAGPCTQQSLCWNSLPTGKDELAGAARRAPTNNNDTLSHNFAVLCIPTPAPALLLAPAKLVVKYTNANLQRATTLALEFFIQGQQQAQSQMACPALESCKKPLKAWFPKLYYGNLHMDCY